MEFYTNLQKCISGFLQISFSIHLKQNQSMELIKIICNIEMVILQGNFPLYSTSTWYIFDNINFSGLIYRPLTIIHYDIC